MPPIVSRILTSLGLIILLPAVFMFVYIASREFTPFGDDPCLIIAGIATAAMLALGWLLIWWTSVRWTVGRIILTLIAPVVTSLAALAVGVATILIIPWGEELGIVLGTIVWGALWLGITPIIWQETKTERIARLGSESTGRALRCPKCTYDMRGLRDARCPECGTQYTLDELVLAANQEQHPVDE